jgi:hypothetical protein
LWGYRTAALLGQRLEFSAKLPRPLTPEKQQMNPTIDIVRGELERLFTLEEMTQMSERLLGLAPTEVGGTSAKGS